MGNDSSAVKAGGALSAMDLLHKACSLFRIFNSAALGFISISLPWSPIADGGNKAPLAQAAPPENNKKTPGPADLKLQFSKAADYHRITTLLDPAQKKAIDPKNYVAKREDHVLRAAINGGSAALLSNAQGDITSMAIAYKIKGAADPAKAGHDYTEIGTTLSKMAGYSSARLVVAALALKEWWVEPPQKLLVTEILPENAPSLKTYAFYLGWRPIGDKTVTTELHRLANETIAPEDRDNKTIWFHCDDSVITHQARTLISFIDQGGIAHKLTKRRISIDFNELDDIGLTYKRLSALAGGETNRARLRKLVP